MAIISINDDNVGDHYGSGDDGCGYVIMIMVMIVMVVITN